MSTRDDGGPAFARTVVFAGENAENFSMEQDHGMSLRAWLAGKALAGITAHHGVTLSHEHRNTGRHDQQAAHAAVRYADATLAELNR